MSPASSGRTLYVLSQSDHMCIRQDRLIGLQRVIREREDQEHR